MNTLNITYTKAQKRVFFESNARFKTIAKGRRLGFTRGCANYLIECLLDESFKVKKALWVDTAVTHTPFMRCICILLFHVNILFS